MGLRSERPATESAALREQLAPLFEAAPRFLARLVGGRPYRSWERLFASAREVARTMPEPEQVELVDAHPRLGAPPPTLSDLSRREQGDDPGHGPEVGVELARLNDAYEARYGFRYCTFVAGRSREALTAELQATLETAPSRASELARAIEAVVDIAQARWRRLAAEGPRRAVPQ